MKSKYKQQPPRINIYHNSVTVKEQEARPFTHIGTRRMIKALNEQNVFQVWRGNSVQRTAHQPISLLWVVVVSLVFLFSGCCNSTSIATTAHKSRKL